ncbi:MAG: DEAD/DEAH box helicase [Myxococcales bacterium]
MKFTELSLVPELLAGVQAAGYSEPTPIQQQAIPPALQGRDVLGTAQTGTGKTAAFALPVLQRLEALVGEETAVRALILTPTRELAAQIDESIRGYGKELELWHTCIFGGVSAGPQIAELRRGVDLVIATPGRLLDLIEQKALTLDQVGLFVLDEADRMLDMGFLPDVKRIVKQLPDKRQTLFFSATMPPEIEALAQAMLRDPVSVSVAPVSSTVDAIEQSLYFVDKPDKRRLLVDLLRNPAVTRGLVFSRTKHGANRIVQHLQRAGIDSAAIHGNKSQGARVRALEGFRSGALRILVATDVAARGIDVEGVSHVLNFDLPNVPETYVHRIGRTARAGASGQALSFCDDEERAYLVDIERLIGKHIPRVEEHPYPPTRPAPPITDLEGRSRPASKRQGGNGGGGGGARRGGGQRGRGRRGGRGPRSGGGGGGRGRGARRD